MGTTSRRGFLTVGTATLLGGGLITALGGCRGASSSARAGSHHPAQNRQASAALPHRAADLDSFLQQLTAAGEFAGVALVAEHGTPVLDRGYGYADRAAERANTADTPFCICSMGKMFTAVAIGQLVDDGRLGFHDPIARYVSRYAFPASIADRVTIAQLLTHTSGMGDALTPTTTPPPETLDGLMAKIATSPLQFAPGKTFSYSNSGFIVLGAIVEQISGLPYAEYVERHVFSPAGMTRTDIRVYVPRRTAGMAQPYTQLSNGSWRDVGEEVQVANPSGGAISTAGDMLRFATALLGHRLMSPATTATMLAGKVRAVGPGRPATDRYGYGFGSSTTNGVLIVGHNGGTPGYECQLDIYPDLGLTVVILTNQDNALMPAITKSESLFTAPLH